MQAFVVAVEYRGDEIIASGSVCRVGIREHAYDLQSAHLAGHRTSEMPRVAFPARQRGWNTDPEFARCADCDAAVESTVRAVIRKALTI